MLTYFAGEEQIGRLTREAAQKGAVSAIDALGHEGQEGQMDQRDASTAAMHSFKLELEGKSLIENKDPTGKGLFMEFVQVVLKMSESFSSYM